MSLVEELALLDPLTNSEAAHYETGNWTKPSWAAAKLTASASGMKPASFASGLSGAYWNAATFKRGGCSVHYGTGAMAEKRYVALWSCLTATHNGYRCQFFDINESKEWKAIIARFKEGTEEILVESAAHGNLEASDLGFIVSSTGTLEAWWKTGGVWTKVAEVADATYTEGFVGIEGSGSNPLFTEYKAASAPAASKLLGMVV